MSDNPYQPTLVPPWAPPSQERRQISILAIVLGVLTDIGGSLILGVVLGVVFAFYLLSQGASPENIADEMQGTTFYLVGTALGLCLTVLGGFIAGKVAKRSEILHGALTGATSTVLGLLMQLVQRPPLWQVLVSAILVIPLAMLGARLAMIGGRKQQIAAESP